MWFDPEHELLPRRIKPVSGMEGFEWTVAEFRKLQNGHWFPQRGTIWFNSDPSDEIESWVVRDLAVNDTLAPSLFDPPKPETGTQVWNLRGGQVRIYRHGEQRNRTQTERALAEQARQNLPPPADHPISAGIPLWQRYGIPTVLVFAGVLVLAAGIWLSRRT